jgi:uncharacterized protein YjiS (DUF1127 family)
MSDRLLHVSAIPSLRFPPLAWPWRAMVLAMRTVVRRRDLAAPGKRQSAGFRLDHALSSVQARRTCWDGGRGQSPLGQPMVTASLRSRLRTGWRRYRSRQRIAALDAHALKDIGVTHAEAEAEANKPFWVA